jgi:hypothetical protein
VPSFRLNTESLLNPTSERSRVVKDVYLVNESDDRVGWLRLNLYDEQRPAHGTECELIAISEGVLNHRHRSSEPDTVPQMPALVKNTGVNDDHFYHVLWIERKGNIAYRRALGQVAKGVWEEKCVGEIEILLG